MVSLPPARLLDARKFGVDVRPLIKGEPATHALRLAGSAVRKLGVGMETGHGSITPGAVARFPGGVDPTVACIGTTGHVRRGENLVDVGERGEAGGHNGSRAAIAWES